METQKWATHRKYLEIIKYLLYHVSMDNKIIWAAGFLDGEGCFQIKRIRYQLDKNKLYYQPYICCGQSEKGMSAIKELQKIFGGGNHLYKHKQKKNALNTITWAVASKKAVDCATKLYPHLVLKQKQAGIIIKFYKQLEIRRKNYRLSNKDQDNRESLYLEMKKLNERGEVYLKRLSEETPKGDAIV